MNRQPWALSAILCTVLALGACSSSRFGSLGPAPVRAAAAPAPMLEPEPVDVVPSGPVVSEPLPPLAGAPVASAPLSSPGTDIAALPPAQEPPPAAPPPVAPSTRSSLVGSWTARDASGSSCRVQLSSAPALDLYRASAASCSNKDLSRVTAWDFRDGEIYLYQPGGAVAARLRSSGGALSGVIAKSGAPLTLAR